MKKGQQFRGSAISKRNCILGVLGPTLPVHQLLVLMSTSDQLDPPNQTSHETSCNQQVELEQFLVFR